MHDNETQEVAEKASIHIVDIIFISIMQIYITWLKPPLFSHLNTSSRNKVGGGKIGI